MDAINLRNVIVLNVTAPITDPFVFQIEYECVIPLKEDLEWQILYVSSGRGEALDEQELETVFVGPVTVGDFKFVFQSNPVDTKRLTARDVGTTGVLLTCSYRDQMFVSVGYYVTNAYDDAELVDSPPDSIVVPKLSRTVQEARVRVFHANISWDRDDGDDESAPMSVLASLPADVIADMMNNCLSEEYDEVCPSDDVLADLSVLV